MRSMEEKRPRKGHPDDENREARNNKIERERKRKTKSRHDIADTKEKKEKQSPQRKKLRSPVITEPRGEDVSYSSAAYRSIFTSSINEQKPATFTHYN